MTPIFFPSTWIPESVRSILFACFEQVILLQPSAKLAPKLLHRLQNNGRLDVRLPDESEDQEGTETLPDLLSTYRAWAELHRGENPAFHKFARIHSAGPEDASIDWIQSRLRNSIEAETGSLRRCKNGENDSLKLARLFLAIAQEYDQQDESLSRDLFAVRNMERDLLQDLSPEKAGDVPAGSHLQPEMHPQRPMPAERLAAWRQLYSHCKRREGFSLPSSPSFFITSDREACHLILAPVNNPEIVCRLTGIPSRGDNVFFKSTTVHRNLNHILAGAANGDTLPPAPTIPFSEDMADNEGTGALTVYRMKDNRITATTSGPENVREPDPTGSNCNVNANTYPFTLLGYIQEN